MPKDYRVTCKKCGRRGNYRSFKDKTWRGGFFKRRFGTCLNDIACELRMKRKSNAAPPSNTVTNHS